MIKLISHTGECEHPDDPSLPFKLELVMRPPSFMVVAFVGLYGGTENVVARADTAPELMAFMEKHGLTKHPRLLRWSITGADGEVVTSFERNGRQEGSP